MEQHPFASSDNEFGYQEQMNGFSFGSDLMNFDSFTTWCDSPSETDTLFTQYGLSTSQPMPLGGLTLSFHDLENSDYGEEMISRSHHSLDSNELSGKRRSVLNCTIPKSLNHSLNEKMLKALSLFMQFSGSGEGILAQVWTPIKTGDQFMLSTCEQPYLLDPKLSQYREASRKFTFASESSQPPFLGLPGRVFISGVSEWTSNVMYYKKDEYLRMKQAIDNQVRGSIAIPILEATGTSCLAVMELVTTSNEKLNFDMEIDSVCHALQAVNLRTSVIPHPQYLSSNQRDALAEIQDVLQALCHAHKLPLALTWIPNSSENHVLCVEETACYVNDMNMEGFVKACLEHPLREKEGIVGKAFVSNQPFFSSDVKAYDISDYPLVHHARKYGLNAAVAIKLRSTYTGEDNYILEIFLPLSMKGSVEQQLLLDSLSDTIQKICTTLRTFSDVEATNSTTNILSDKDSTGSQQDMSKGKTLEKKKGATEKNVSLSVLQQHFSGSLKDAAKSIGVCPTTLKRMCRQHGVMRWPSRKINKVNRSLRKIQTVLDSVHGVEGGLRFDSVKGEFVAVGSSNGNNAHVRGHEDMVEDTSCELLEAKSVDNTIKLEDDIITNGSFMEVNASGQQTSSQAITNGMDTTIRGSGNIMEPNRSMSDSSMLRSSSTSMDDRNQMSIKKGSNSSESGSKMITVKATYREDTIRFKFEPSVGFLHLYKEVGKRFKLQEGLFQLKYLDDEEEWVMLVTDSDLQECLEILYGMEKHTAKFLVRDLPGPLGSSAGSNT